MDLLDPPPVVDSPDGRCLAYYDPMNFAPDARCPVLMNAGMIDPASPPFSVWGVFNRLATREKTLIPLPGLAHVGGRQGPHRHPGGPPRLRIFL